MSALEVVANVGLIAVVTIILIAEILNAAYHFLGWPKWLVRHYDKPREDEVRRVIDALGIDKRLLRTSVQAALVTERASHSRYSDKDDITKRASRLIAQVRLRGEFKIGRRNKQPYPDYFDAFAGTMNKEWADEAVSIMVSYLRVDIPSLPPFTKIVGIKHGTPVLAWLAADRLDLPCVLHRGKDASTAKPWGSTHEPTGHFDGKLTSDDVVLLVDDSTTGGRLALDAVEQIRELGATVGHLLVLFTPVGKDAKKLLGENDVKLISVLTLDEQTLDSLPKEESVLQ